MKILEFWWYELSPYIYATCGAYFTLNIKNVGMYFAFALVILSILILTMRIHYRSGIRPLLQHTHWHFEQSQARRRSRESRRQRLV
jgi:hypothetical protein